MAAVLGLTAPVYNNRRWKRVRLEILERDQHQCRIQLPGCRLMATEVDHIVDWRYGGAKYDPENLRAACKPCNVAQRNHRVAARRHRRTRSRDW